MGTAGTDKVAASAYDESGNLFVASVQNGHAIVSKYAGGDITTAPQWQSDLGDLGSNGALNGLVVKSHVLRIETIIRDLFLQKIALGNFQLLRLGVS